MNSSELAPNVLGSKPTPFLLIEELYCEDWWDPLSTRWTTPPLPPYPAGMTMLRLRKSALTGWHSMNGINRPKSVTVIAWVWIVLGCLMFVSAAVGLLLAIILSLSREQDTAVKAA